MTLSSFDAIFKEIEVSPDHPLFYQRICTLFSKKNLVDANKKNDDLLVICTDEFDELSHMLDKTMIQESCSVRNVLKARRIATYLIKDDGEFATDLLDPLIERMKENLSLTMH